MPPADRSRGVGAQQPLTTDEVEALIARLSSRFDWDADWNDPVIESLWSTRFTGNRFALVRPRDGNDQIVVKMLGRRDNREIERGTGPGSLLASRMADLADLLDKRCPADAYGPRPLGWLNKPPVVAVSFIEGTELRKAIGKAGESPPLTERWVRSAGAALAAYHEGGPSAGDAGAQAIGELEATLGRYPLSERWRATLLDYGTNQGVLAPRFQDFSTTNILGREDGKVVILDPPIELEDAPRHRDIARFLTHIRRNLAGLDLDTARTADPKRPEALRSQFLEGYEGQSVFNVEADRGGALLALYESVEALGFARRRARRRRLSQDPWRSWRSVAWGTANGLYGRVKVTRQMRRPR